MQFEFDPSKDTANRAKHGVELMLGAAVFDDPAHVVLASIRPIDGEDRYKAVGRVGLAIVDCGLCRTGPCGAFDFGEEK